MPLPAKFTNTHYYLITGQYTYAGDLVIIPQTLYYFPVADLEAERNKRSRIGAHFGAVGFAAAYIGSSLIKTGYGSTLEASGLWPPGVTAEQFRQLADAHLTKLRAERTTATFSDLLPLPTRIQANEMTAAQLGALGTLSFLAQSDDHDLKVGLRRKRALRDALWEAGLVKL